jgi:drug/metabolite transporter (DMT)-like permease
MHVPFPGELAALGAAVCWSLTPFVFESAGKRVGSLVVNLLRLVVAVALLAAIGLGRRGMALPLDATPSAWLWLSLSGLVGFTFGDLCLFRAFVVIGPRLSGLLMALVPPIMGLFGFVILGERLGAREWLGMAVTVGGVAWVVLERPDKTGESPARPRPGGILLGVGGAVGQAGGLLLSKIGMRSYDAFAATQIRVLVGGLGFALIFTLLGWWPRVGHAFRDARSMGHIGIGALLGPCLGVALSLLAVQHAPVGVAATIMALVPVLMIPAAWWLRRDKASWRAMAGASLAVAGAGLFFL